MGPYFIKSWVPISKHGGPYKFGEQWDHVSLKSDGYLRLKAKLNIAHFSVENCWPFNFFFFLNQRYDISRAVMLKYRQMIIISHWMIVSLLLLAVCSVGCNWRYPIPARGFDDLVFVKRSQSSPELSNTGRCPPPNICIPTLSCPDVLSLLRKAVREPYLREQTISLVRRNGPRSIFTIANVPR